MKIKILSLIVLSLTISACASSPNTETMSPSEATKSVTAPAGTPSSTDDAVTLSIQDLEKRVSDLQKELDDRKTAELAAKNPQYTEPQYEAITPELLDKMAPTPNIADRTLPSVENTMPRPEVAIPTVSGALVPPTETGTEAETVADAGQTEVVEPAVQPVEAPIVEAPKTAPVLVGDKAKYSEALKLYQTRRYKEAITAFKQFQRDYPSSMYAVNAIYWIGEAEYGLGNYASAILQFKDVLARYPKSNKVADSLLKITLCYSRLKDDANAQLHATVLFEDWPNSDAALKARQLNLQPMQ